MNALHGPLNRRVCITISRCGTCFSRDGRPCVTNCEQCEKGSKAYIERDRGSEWDFEQPACTLVDLWVWSFLKMGHSYNSFALLAAAPLPRTHRFYHELYGVVIAFWLCLHFHYQTSQSPSFFFLLLLLILTSQLIMQLLALLQGWER